jgi:molecular chaperone GrpE
MTSSEDTNTGPVIRDLRRIDPVTGQVRDPGEQGRREPDPRAPGKPRPGRHAASRPGGTGARPAAPPAGGSAGGPPGGPGPGAPGPGGPDAAAQAEPGHAGGTAAPGAPGAAPAGGPAPQGAPTGPPAGDAGPDGLMVQLAERTADLQRLQAEYANYRKRVERDRLAVREQALANVLSALLPVLDDIGRAREHGELTGGFKSVGESLETIAAKLGLDRFGDAGEPFDPRVHEALMHSYSPDVTEPTAVQILQPGYKVGDRIIRPARVAVAEPGAGPDGGEPSPADQGTGPGRSRGTPAGNN